MLEIVMDISALRLKSILKHIPLPAVGLCPVSFQVLSGRNPVVF